MKVIGFETYSEGRGTGQAVVECGGRERSKFWSRVENFNLYCPMKHFVS